MPILWHFLRLISHFEQFSAVQLDKYDRAILGALQKDGRISNVQLAATVNLSESACLRRVRALEDEGMIDRYVALVNHSLAGLGGIRLVLLVVAADEGVKPQTREHLAICSLLEIPHAVVALTKCDLVTPDLLELAQLELEEILFTRMVIQ